MQDPLYTFQAGDTNYEAVTGSSGVLKPYEGYWLYAFQPCTPSGFRASGIDRYGRAKTAVRIYYFAAGATGVTTGANGGKRFVTHKDSSLWNGPAPSPAPFRKSITGKSPQPRRT